MPYMLTTVLITAQYSRCKRRDTGRQKRNDMENVSNLYWSKKWLSEFNVFWQKNNKELLSVNLNLNNLKWVNNCSCFLNFKVNYLLFTIQQINQILCHVADQNYIPESMGFFRKFATHAENHSHDTLGNSGSTNGFNLTPRNTLVIRPVPYPPRLL